MKRKIIFGSVLSICILLLLPSVPAVEYNVALDSNESNIFDKVTQIKININDLKEKLKDNDIRELKEIVRNIDFKKLKEKINDIEIQNVINELNSKLTDQKVEPKCIISLTLLKTILVVISLIVSFGSMIIFAIINTLALIIFVIIVVINLIISLILFIIQAILSTLIGIIDSILQIIFDILFPNKIAISSY